MEKTQPQPANESRTDAARTSRSIWASLAPPLAAAVICTALICEAIKTALTGRANGDLMVMVCPLLGAIFLAIPAGQAWVAAIRIVARKRS